MAKKAASSAENTKGDALKTKLEQTGKLTSQELRQANANGLVEDKQIVELDFPGSDTLVGYGTMVRGELYARQKELSVPGHEDQTAQFLAECKKSLADFIPTIKEPTEDKIDNMN